MKLLAINKISYWKNKEEENENNKLKIKYNNHKN
jgi:hypothetical protein